MKVIDSIATEAAGIAALRRDIHAHPELCFEERRTADLVVRQLEAWGIEVHRGLGKTGRGGRHPQRHLQARHWPARRHGRPADPGVQHLRPTPAPHPGKMHACGHDGHVAMLLGAAQHLAKHRDFDGSVVLVFQPAEEGGGGRARDGA